MFPKDCALWDRIAVDIIRELTYEIFFPKTALYGTVLAIAATPGTDLKVAKDFTLASGYLLV